MYAERNIEPPSNITSDHGLCFKYHIKTELFYSLAFPETTHSVQTSRVQCSAVVSPERMLMNFPTTRQYYHSPALLTKRCMNIVAQYLQIASSALSTCQNTRMKTNDFRKIIYKIKKIDFEYLSFSFYLT